MTSTAAAILRPAPLSSAKELETLLGRARYLADPSTALTAWLGLRMKRPVLLEGPAGVGKTDLARAAAEALGRPLVRLQCYEGLDEAKALYEWDYAKQMLYTQLLRDVVAREVVGAESIAGAAASFRFGAAGPTLVATASRRSCV